MICILGPSASGKTTIEKELVKVGLPNIISYTSRPIRKGETNHQEYHFVTDGDFEHKLSLGFFAEHTLYNGWHYGIASSDCNENAIGVVERHGYKQLKNKLGNKVFSIFLSVPQRVCLKRMIDRGDILLECFRRIFSDEGNFYAMEEDVDVVVNNDRPLSETMTEIFSILKNRKAV